MFVIAVIVFYLSLFREDLFILNSVITLLNKKQKQKLIRSSKEKKYLAGDTLFNRGEPAEEMFLVKQGKVSLFYLMPNGDEKLFKVFVTGDLIAEMAVFMEPRCYSMTAKIDEKSTILSFTHRPFVPLMDILKLLFL